jgi:hypothetical protein
MCRKHFRIISTCILLTIVIVLFSLCGCSKTMPLLAYSGGQYNSVSDDIIIHNSMNKAIEKLVAEINPNQKIALVQVVNNSVNDLVADRIYEELYKKRFIVAKLKQEEIKKVSSDLFTHYLMVYPSVCGTEHSLTKPTVIAQMAILGLSIVPVVGWIMAPSIEQSMTHNDRYSAVSLHARLVDAKSGKILWIKDFSGSDEIRLEGGLKSLVF